MSLLQRDRIKVNVGGSNRLNANKSAMAGGPAVKKDEPSIADFLSRTITQQSESGLDKQRESSEEVRRRETMNKFKNAFQDQMIEDFQEGEGHVGFLDYAKNLHVTQDGQLTENFKKDLRKSMDEEAERFEDKIKSARPADRDLFGIKRRYCEVCEIDCQGYEAQKVLFGGRGEFPTFCRHCNCPAHFHKVEEEDQMIPESLSDLITGKNIQSQDLNFNCVMAAFFVKNNGNNKTQTAIDIARLIKEEGIEILTSQFRFLSEQEAFYLRNRIIGQSERQMAHTLAQDFQRPSFEQEIKKKGEIDSLNVNALKDNNSYLMERLSQIKEYHISKMRETFTLETDPKRRYQQQQEAEQKNQRGQANSLPHHQSRSQVAGSGNLENKSDLSNPSDSNEGFDLDASINQRDPNFKIRVAAINHKSAFAMLEKVDSELNQPLALPLKKTNLTHLASKQGHLASIVEEDPHRPKSSLKKKSTIRSSSMPFDRANPQQMSSGRTSRLKLDLTDVFAEIQRRESIMPKPYKSQFKVKYGRKTKDAVHKQFVEEVQEYRRAEFLVHALETNPLLREICENEIFFVVLNSATGQGFQSKVQKILQDSQLTSDEAVLLYASDNKVKAMEDCVQFAPELFRLSKSIIVSEPIIPFMELIKMKMIAQGHVHGGFSQRSGADSIQSDYIKDRLKTMQTGASGTMRAGTRAGTGRQQSMRTGAGMSLKPPTKSQNSTINPYREKVSLRKTQYNDMKTMAIQKKLSVIDKVGTQSKGDQTRLTVRKMVTFKEGGANGGSSSRRSGSVSRRSFCAIGEEVEEEDLSDMDWVKRARERGNKDEKLERGANLIQYNYGVMQDFFAYSATCIQQSLQDADLAKPVCPTGIRGGKSPIDWRDLSSHPVNLFAIARVGIANLIMPNTLDVKLANYQDFDSYISISDYFFPDYAKSQHSVIVLRPVIVKNGLNELLLKIVQANEFLILKRQIRMLTKAEVAYLFRSEKIQARNSKLYFDMMMSGPSEIIMVSKISAVHDCNTLFNGANPYGRRRINFTNEGQPQHQIRKNVDSVDGLFEISPFTCFSEFVDFEDFLVRNSKIDKFRKHGRGAGGDFDKTAELLYSTKLKEIMHEANLLQRNFNVVGYTASNVQDAQREVCIFSPALASIQEVCLILNPLYNDQAENAIEVLIRANFVIIYHETKQLSEEQAEDFFGQKYGYEEGSAVTDIMMSQPVHCFHLAKVAGDREVRELFRQSDLQFEDLISISNWSPPFKPSQIPYLFFFMDTETTFELCLHLMYSLKSIAYTGKDFEKMNNGDAALILQGCLLVTVGDKLKYLLIDNNGNVKQQSELPEGTTKDHFEPMNKHMMAEKAEGVMEGCYLEPQVLYKSGTLGKKASSVAYVAEADNHGLFEVRFHRLAHKGDRENSDDFPQKQIKYDMAVESMSVRESIQTEALLLFERFASLSFYYNEVNKLCYNVCPAFYKFKIKPFDSLFENGGNGRDDDSEVSSFVTDAFFEDNQSEIGSVREQKVHPTQMTGALSFVTMQNTQYETSQKNKRMKDLRDKIHREREWKELRNNRKINRVYEVEEHMGSEFMEELARLHQEHLNILRHGMTFKINLDQTEQKQERQKSLPAYIYGLKLAEMVKNLEKVKCFSKGELRGAGKIHFNRKTHVLQGELPRVTQSNYYDFDRNRYLGMLENFKGGWGYYLSVLETEIIESKLMFILDSLTFKYTRQPQFLTIFPDRLTGMNLRISEKIKVLNPDSANDNTSKFFKPLSEDLIDPNRELDVRNHVDSVLQTLNHSILKQSLDQKLRKEGTSIQQILDQQKDDDMKKEYSIHKDCAIAGFDGVCRRPKYHMIASVLWLIDFNLRKVNRKSEFFIGDRNRKIEQVKAAVEDEYDEILDTLKSSILANYQVKPGQQEVNEALDIVDLKEGGYETDFERHMRLKNYQEEKKLKEMQEQIETEKRRQRTTMTIEELIQSQIHNEADQFKKQQRKELEEFLNMRAGMDKDGSEFMKMLEKSKMHFGPYALQLAEEFFTKQMKQFAAKIDPSKRDEQEKISYVKMEVFLYGVAEANRLIEQLKSMELRMNKMAAEADTKQQEAEHLKLSVDNLGRAPTMMDAEGTVRENQMRKIAAKAEEEVQKVDAKMNEQRHEISAKETELLLVFRELMGYDFYVPDYFFDKDYLLRKKEKQVLTEKFVLPLKTFWQPLTNVGDLRLGDEYYEHDMKDKKFMKKVGAMETIDQTIGQYLAKPLRDSLIRTEQSRIAKLREGEEQTSLYPVTVKEKKETIVFDKYMSHGQQRQDALLQQSKNIIDQKTSKKTFTPDVPFHFTR